MPPLSDTVSLFFLGLLSSLSHCVGMCGGFVYCYSARLATRSLWPHLTYNFGRILTYAILGGTFAFLSRTTASSIGFVRWQALVQTIAGIVMVLMGGSMLGLLKLPGFLAAPLDRVVVPLATKLFASPRTPLFALGLVLGTIPCGLVYTAGLKAAAAASPWHGAVLMASFGFGTMPALVLLGWGSTTLLERRHRQLLTRVSAVLVLVLATITLRQAYGHWTRPIQTTPESCPLHGT